MKCRFAAGIILTLAAATTASAYDNLTPLVSHDAVVHDGAYILDVRTAAEFIWVGHPNVPNVVNVSWKIEKKGAFITNPSFVTDVNDTFGNAKDTHLILMCRSGVRSLAAAAALEAAGYTNVSNMLDGFEGEGKDQYGYRTVNGWKNSGLPGHTSAVGASDYYKD
uniref:rhodanese-like domain-containing protein n=1 Tax=Candidatus Electronema sp. TaxID=2698783 RepID=UPI0040565F1B